MTSAFAILSIATFLAGTASGILILFVVSIHRTRHATLTQTRHERPGSTARSMLTRTRADNTQATTQPSARPPGQARVLTCPRGSFTSCDQCPGPPRRSRYR
jgi:hypothetical protein